MPTPIEDPLPIVRSPNYERNAHNYTHGGQCEVCGKAVRQSGLWLAVNHQTFEAVSVAYAMHDEDACSFFPIGPACARKFPATHVWQRRAVDTPA